MKQYLFAVLLFLALSSSALAQTPAVQATITVEGQITNGTPGGSVPTGLPLMLHTYEGETMIGMTDGTLDPQGRFRFENVATAPGRSFEVMVIHWDVPYFSAVQEPAQGQEVLELPVRIYETTPDTGTVRVEQAHVLLDFIPGALQVAQVYILSNDGDRTVVGDAQTAPLRFRLPAGATDLTFNGDPEGDRFVKLGDAFADKAPVRPGLGSHQIIASYILPYDGRLQVELPVDYSTTKVTVLLPDVNVTLKGVGLGLTEERLVQGQVYLVFRGPSLQAGEALTLDLAGQPTLAPPVATPVEAQRRDSRLPVLIGGVMLALLVIAAGIVWWWQGSRKEAIPIPSAQTPDDLEALVQAIADLDDAREAGTIEEEAYREKRTRLRTQAVALLAERRKAT